VQLESGFVWNNIKANLPGAELPGKALSYDSSEFGIILQKEITQLLEHIFGAKTKKSHGTRMLVFDTSKLKRLGNVYDLAPEVKVVEGDSEETGADLTDWTDVGIGQYVEPSTNENKEIEQTSISERANAPDQGIADSQHVSNVPHPTPDTEAANRLKEYERLSKKSREASKAAEEQLPPI
jgi:hypothetical protein